MSHVIRIPDQIFKRLKDLAEPFTDTPATVIEKLLDFYEKNPNKALINSNKEPEQAKELNYDYREFKAHKPPNLKHTKVEKVILGTLPPSYKTNWNKLVQDIHRLAMERAKSFDALQLVTNFNIKQGEFIENGFQYLPGIDISIQNVDSNRAWEGIFQLATKLDIRVEVYFHWRNKPDAQYPNKRGVLRKLSSESFYAN